MSNSFNFHEMPPPANGLGDVRQRARTVAIRARVVRAAQTAIATAVALLALLAAGLFDIGNQPQFARSSDQATEMSAPNNSAGNDAGVGVENSLGSEQPAARETPTSEESPVVAESTSDLRGYAFIAVGSLLLMALVRVIVAGAKSEQPSSRLGVGPIVLASASTAIVIYGILKILN